MFTKISIKAVVKNRTDKLGFTPVLIRVTINRKVKYYRTNERVKPLQFSNENGLVKPKMKGGNVINLKIAEEIESLQTFLRDKESINHDTITAFFNGSSVGANVLFSELAEKYLDTHKDVYSESYIRACRSRLKRFIQFAPNIKAADITKPVLLEYETHLQKELKQTTVFDRIKFVRTVINYALYKLEILEKDNLKGLKVSRGKTERAFLELSELKQLTAYFENEINPLKTRRAALWYLLVCETGLRYSDFKKNIDNIITSGKFENTLFHYANKTAEPNPIPLTDTAKKYLSLIIGNPDFNVKVYSGQKLNDYIQLAAATAGITKHLTMHTARHTCATQMLEAGVPMEAIKQMLGHTKLETTQIYARIRNSYLESEIKKLNQRRNEEI